MKKALLVAMLAGVTAVACAQDKAPAGAAKTQAAAAQPARTTAAPAVRAASAARRVIRRTGHLLVPSPVLRTVHGVADRGRRATDPRPAVAAMVRLGPRSRSSTCR